MKSIALIALIIALLLSACQSTSQLEGTSWQLVTYGDANNPVPALPNSAPTLQFLTDGKFTANTGCNGAGGEYQEDGNNLQFSNIVSTLVACLEPERADQETAFIDGLNKAQEFSLQNDKLVIYYESKTKALTFTRTP